MSAGLSHKFSLLQRSPLDLQEFEGDSPGLPPEEFHWVPSRYNVRAKTQDGRLVLWNSFTGTMSVFDAGQGPIVESLLARKGFVSTAKGIARYLFQRGFLVKSGSDEYRRIQFGFGQQQYRTDTLQLILLASEDCNLRCDYCYESFARGTMKPWVRRGLKNLIEKRLQSLGHLSVSWFGGEPLYGFDAIEDLAPYFLGTATENRLRFSSHMTTNGFLLTQEVADKLLSWGINSFQITIDGPPEVHDRNRPTRDGHGSFEVIWENLKSLKGRSDAFVVDLRFNFDRKSGAAYRDLLGMFESEFKGDSRFKLRFRAIGQWGGPNDANLDVCGGDESARLQSEMTFEARKMGLSLADDISSVAGLGAQVCYAARPYNFIVGATGKLMKCTIDLDSQDRNVVGSLTEDGDLRLDLDKMALWTEPAFESDSKCKKCVVLPACQGMYCPQIRMDHGISPCSPLRMGAKGDLLHAAEAMKSSSRRILINKGVRTKLK
jgi:uncharacterized protein